jgi:hypothetical protein
VDLIGIFVLVHELLELTPGACKRVEKKCHYILPAWWFVEVKKKQSAKGH